MHNRGIGKTPKDKRSMSETFLKTLNIYRQDHDESHSEPSLGITYICSWSFDMRSCHVMFR